MAQHILELPIKPYLKKYLLAITTGQEPIKASRSDVFGLVVFGAIERSKTTQRMETEEADSVKISMNASLQLKGFNMRSDAPDVITIPRDKALLIEKFVSKQFDHWLYLFIEANKIAKREQKAAIFHFLAKYDITEEDITYETIKKRLYRTQKRFAKNASVS